MARVSHPWRNWYKLKRWLDMRESVLRSRPLCVMCERDGRVVAAVAVDHVKPHRGDADLFWFGELQGLCSPCHDSRKRAIELRGYDATVGADGWPTDAAHPANRPR
jgi:5-methylcytosine-specific restriction endonuclease McrA